MAVAPPGELSKSRLRLGILLPVVVVTVASVILAGSGLYWTSVRSDAVSIDRQIRETRHALSSSVDEVAVQQEVVAVWEDPVLRLRKRSPDWEWFDTNIGVWLHDLFAHDRVFILDPNNTAVYGTSEGKRTDPGSFTDLRLPLQPLIDRIRGRKREPGNSHERLPDQTPPKDAPLRTSANAVHASDLLELGERPAAVSVMRIDDPAASTRPRPGKEHLLISVRFLDTAFLDQLSKRNLIASPRFARVPAKQSGEHVLALTSGHGQHIGYFFWRPELPGTAILHSLAPLTAAAVALMIGLMSLLAFSLLRALRKQDKTLTELQVSQGEARRLAFYDPLTGLPNRALLQRWLVQVSQKAQQGTPAALLLLDLDRFKEVNDAYGHPAGDQLIRDFGARMLTLLEDDEMIARLGGDEFAIISERAGSPEGVSALCQRILEAIHQPFDLFGIQAYVGVSAGVAIASDAGCEPMDLMRRADIALYAAKADGRAGYRLFTPSMDALIQQRARMAEELRSALATGRGLHIHYQPQVAGLNKQIVGLEALVRWDHPTQGMISPDQFIPVAEQSGLIGPLGEWVLREACIALNQWPQIFMAVNLSPLQLRSSDFAKRVLSIMSESGTDPSRIELEITEGVLLEHNDQALESLKILRNAGVKIALDDFGTGYSSISYLRRIEVDKIKIDRSFIQQLGEVKDSAAIVTAVVTLSHAMGLTVTAEGVETAEQTHFLTAVGCNGLQGYFFSRALGEDAVAQLLSAQHPLRGVA